MINILKKGLIYFILILSTGTIFSCTDMLDEVIYSELTEDNAFKTKDDAIAAVNAMYDPLHGVTNRAIFYLNDMTTDACFMKEMDCELLNELKMSTNGDISNSWDGYYRIVSRANIVLDNVSKIEENLFADDDAVSAKKLKNRLLGEAYFMRAFAYYQLTDLFYTVPLVISSDVAIDAKIAPSSIIDIEKQISSDLIAAKEMLPKSYASKLDAGRCTFGSTVGFLCRLHMRAAGRARLNGGDANSEWEKALSYAEEVLALESDGTYALQAKVWDVFNPETDETVYNNELIFAVRASKDIPSGSSDIGLNFTPWDYDMGWNLFSIPLETVWKFDKDDERYSKLLITNFRNVYDNETVEQPRYYNVPASIDKVGTVYDESPTKIINELGAAYTQKYKYLRPGTYNYNTNNNMPILRLADIILCKAEVLNELNGPTQAAIDLINQIRSRAFGNDTKNLILSNYATKDDLRNAICDERLFELNNEGMRRPDLIRMGLWENRMMEYVVNIKSKSEWRQKNSEDPNADYSSDWKVYPQDLTNNDIRRYFPVPKRELDLNPDLANCRNF